MKLTRVLTVVTLLALTAAAAQAPAPAPHRQGWQQRQHQMEPGFHLYFEAAKTMGIFPQELFMLSQGEKTLAEVAKLVAFDVAKLETELVKARNLSIDQAVQNKALTAEDAAKLKGTSVGVVRALIQAKIVIKQGARGQGGQGRFGGGKHQRFGPGNR